jgi:hypothetical protein
MFCNETEKPAEFPCCSIEPASSIRRNESHDTHRWSQRELGALANVSFLFSKSRRRRGNMLRHIASLPGPTCPCTMRN